MIVIVKNNIIEQFQLVYICDPNLIQNMSWKDQEQRSITSTFDNKQFCQYKKVEEILNLCYCTSHVIWEHKTHNFWGVSISYILQHGKIFVLIIYVYSRFYVCCYIKDFKTPKSMIYQRFLFHKYCLRSCLVMGLWNNIFQLSYWHVVVNWFHITYKTFLWFLTTIIFP